MQMHIELLDIIQKQKTQLDTVVSDQAQTGGMLKTMDTELRQLSTVLAPVSELDDSDESEEEEDVEADGVLLIGDSMIRDVLPTCDDLSVDSMSGAKFVDIKNKMKKINPRKRKYKNITIVCGTNDSATRKPADKIAQECKNAILEAKLRADHVTVSSILPRCDTKADMPKIDNVNQLILTTCNDMHVQYVNHDQNCRYRDDTIDNNLLLPCDNLHPSALGLKKMMSNLNLSDKTKPAFGNGPTNRWQISNQQQSLIPDAWQIPLTPPTPPPPLPSRPIQPGPTPILHGSKSRPAKPIKFKGGRSSFSNFHRAHVKIWGMTFLSSEHAYQYRKAVTMNQWEEAETILHARTPHQAKEISQDIITDQRWQNIRIGVMYDILREKVRQCHAFLRDLKASNERVLIEDTEDEYWGCGSSGQGQNTLGRLLMTLREEISNQQFTFTPMPQNSPHRDVFGQTRPTSRSQQLCCFNCGEISHNANKCFHESPLQCHMCFGEGHKQKFCPMRNDGQNQAPYY